MFDMLEAMRSAGLEVKHLNLDGEIHRVPTVSKPNSLNGWYTAINNELIVFGDWESNTKTVLSSRATPYSPEIQFKITREIELKKQEIRRKQHNAAIDAQQIYKQSLKVDKHPYLDAKGLVPYPNILCSAGKLAIPVFELSKEQARIGNLQLIDYKGHKRFLPGGRIKGFCYSYGLSNVDSCRAIYVCEGVATALSLHMNNRNIAVAAALTANNLDSVTKTIVSLFPSTQVIIAGDDDWLTEQKTGKNPGKHAAIEAAMKYNVNVSFPPFDASDKKLGLTDWNDYYLTVSGSREHVRTD
ncbi:toprim domain-containing protein [Vibrio sinaloensis]|uniref:toprim domain-containing protein n=1 Tax=Photobacterium sp. (strain ATCC 43367) TaxID=379097 RepID=UPI0020702F55|nr:toprim domain-containing protein [Vibrio sinaloensis]UPQ87360.1 toprim domain-containing protein [Vibrio sinaloensis]